VTIEKWIVTFTVLAPYNTAPHNHYQPHPAEPAQHTTCSNTRLVLLKMGIIMPETCWESVDNKHHCCILLVFSLTSQLKYFQIMSLMFYILHHHQRKRTTRYNTTYYWTMDSVYVKTVGCNVTISHYCHNTKYQLTNSNSHTMYILKNQSNLKLQDIFARLPCQSFTLHKNTTLMKVAKFTNITIHHTRTFI